MIKKYYQYILFGILTPVISFAATDYGKITENKRGSIKSFIGGVQNYLIGFTGAIAVLFIIYGGFLYITSRGNKDQAERAKKTLTYAIIGLALVISAQVIFNVIENLTGIFVGTENLGE